MVDHLSRIMHSRVSLTAMPAIASCTLFLLTTRRIFLYLLWILAISYGVDTTAQTLTGQPVIFNAGLTAKPGEAFGLQGSFSGQARVYLSQPNSAEPVLLPALVQSDDQVTVRLPTTLDPNLYYVWVDDQGQRSERVYVNRAVGMHLNTPEITPGGTVRIFGRNLQVVSGAARVRFVDQTGHDGGWGTVDPQQSDAYTLALTAPGTLQPGTAYTLLISNGYGGDAGETAMEQAVVAIAPGPDYFGLGVGWGAKFDFYPNVYNVKTDDRLPRKAVGDGLTDDQPAIQDAIDRAGADGGGIVYLPAGTYALHLTGTDGLTLRSRVVVQGAGRDLTSVTFGTGMTDFHTGIVWPSATKQSGLADLSLRNVDTTGRWASNLTGQGTELFLQRIRFELNRGDGLRLADSDKVVVANSTFKQGVSSQFEYRGPVHFVACSNLIISDNVFTYAVDGLNLNFAQNALFTRNIVNRDGNARYPADVINHVVIANFAHNIAITQNQLRLINPPAQNKNDGEAIIAEGGGPNRIDEEAGQVSRATPTTLQDDTKNWGPNRLHPVVAIVHGPGMGQWRQVNTRQGNTLTLERPWAVLPTSASRYALFNWGAKNWLVAKNVLTGHQRGITLYHNASNGVAIVGNTLTNSGSIDLTPVQQLREGHQQFIPMYNNQIINNQVANTDGSNGVFIGVHVVQYLQARTFGTAVVGLEVRGNELRAGVPSVPAVVDASFPEGYLNYLQYQPGGYYEEEGIGSIVGSIFENNRAINCASGVYLNSGSYNTAVCHTDLVNSGNEISDETLERVNHASVATVTCSAFAANHPAPPELRLYPNPVGNHLYVQLPVAGAQLSIRSPAGTLLLNVHSDTATTNLDVGGLSVGLYILSIQFDSGERMSYRFIRQTL